MTRITLELPDELMQRVKMRAERRRQKLKDAVAQLLELGIAESLDQRRSTPAPRPVRLKGRARLTIEDIEEAISAGLSP